MGIKNFFGENNSEESQSRKTVIPMTSLSGVAVSSSVESPRFIQAKKQSHQRFIPQVDFSKPANFAVYGSAEEYYRNSVRHIYASYPYDGSGAEKEEWHNSSSYWENYVFENEYPRTNGFAKFSPSGWGTLSGTAVNGYALSNRVEYIKIYGGPNTSTRKQGDSITGSISPGNFKDGFANIFDEASNRGSNLLFGHAAGNTIEFWMKKAAHSSAEVASSKREVLFDVWNKIDYSSDPSNYGRLTLEFTTGSSVGDTQSPIELTMISGTSGFTRQPIGTGLTRALVYDNTWHHYAVTMKTGSSAMKVEVYVDGVWKSSHGLGSKITSSVGMPHLAYIGALMTNPSGATSMQHRGGPSTEADGSGWGKFSGSIDEFRFWKRARTSQDIGRHWYTPVHGATNEDRSTPADLGIYYKFNEGITGDRTLDSIALDYSGRISNGNWVVTGSSGIDYIGSTYRSTDSAIVLASAAATEYKDPILRPTHTEVQTYLTAAIYSASFHDDQNGNMIYHQLPSWVTEEDLAGSGELKKICQIMASYLDSVNLQIKSLPSIRHISYSEDVSGSKPYPFMKGMLYGMGFDAPDLFTETTALQQYMDRDERIQYEEKLNDIKNLIYRNIYNNLTYIYKTKGTEKGLRNLLRCFGFDDEIYKLNFYGQNVTYDFKDRYKNVSSKKNYVNFYDSRWPSPTAYNKTEANVYLTGTAIPGVVQNSGMGMTIECETKFPKRVPVSEDIFVSFAALSSSIFGLTQVATDDGMTVSNNFAQVYAVKQGDDHGRNHDNEEAKDAKFYCKLWTGAQLTSSIYKEVYNNESWHFSVKFEPVKLASMVTSSFKNQTGVVTFTGINTVGDQIINNFSLTSSITGPQLRLFEQAKKRSYFGATRTNFTSSVTMRSDIRVGSMRAWMAPLSQKELEAHAKDVSNHGRTRPSRNAFLSQTSASQNYIPNIETLVYNWDFSSNTTASAAGAFTVKDISNSASLDWYGGTTGLYGTGSLNTLLNRRFAAEGTNFAPNATVVDRDYELSGKHQLPEVVNSSDQIKILDQDDINFTKTTRPTNMVAMLEKSMYQIISEDMINMFAGITEFNNLIGAPVHKYRQEYKGLSLLRKIYFDKVGNTPDIDKFINYYRWMDDSVSQVLRQILPMSADISDKVSNVVESHVLERNKYWHKFPTMEFKQDDPEGSIRGINELRYPWKYGHAPVAEENFYSLQHPKLVEQWGSSSIDQTPHNLKWIRNSGSTAIDRSGVALYNSSNFVFLLNSYGAVNSEAKYRYLQTKGKISGPFKLYCAVGSWRQTNAWNMVLSGGVVGTSASGTPTAVERLYIEYSLDGTTWVEFGPTNLYSDDYGGAMDDTFGTFTGVNAAYTGNEDVYVRFAQKSTSGGSNYDMFSIDQIRILGIDHAYWSKYRKIRTDSTASVINTARENLRQIMTTHTTGSAPLLSSSNYTSYRGGTFALRNFSKPQKLVVDDPGVPIGGYRDTERELGLPSKFANKWNKSQIFGYHRGVLKSDDDTSFIEIDYHQDDSWRVFEKIPMDLKNFDKRINTRARVYRNGVHETGSYDSIKSMAVLPFTVYSSSVTTGYVSAYRVENTSSLDFNNLHHDNGGHNSQGLQGGASLQGPFTEMYVGGLQYRHQMASIHSASTRYNRGEGWYITTPGSDGLDFNEILSQSWDNGTTGWTYSSAWTVWSGSTPTSGTGPDLAKDGSALATHGAQKDGSYNTGKYIYVDTIVSGASGTGSIVYLYSPSLNTSELMAGGNSLFTGSFYYHMHGQDCGKLSLQIQNAEPSIPLDASGVWNNVTVQWDGNSAEYIFGEQHTSGTAAWSNAWFDLSYLTEAGKNTYLRWKYEAGPTILGEVAVDKIRVTGVDIADFRLFNGDYSNSREFPNANYYRDEVSKRPVNIKNIRQRTGSTIIGNYSQPYELVQTSDRSINNMWFRENVHSTTTKLGRGQFKNFSTSSFVRTGKVTRLENAVSSSFHFDMGADVWKANAQTTGSNQQKLSQRTGSAILGTPVVAGNSASINKYIFAERFAAPGDRLTMGRGRLDPISEQFAANNALTWRNITERNKNQKELTRHSSKGGYGYDGLKWSGYLEGEDSYLTYGTKHWKLGVSASHALAGEVHSSASYDFEDLDYDADNNERTYSFWIKTANYYDQSRSAPPLEKSPLAAAFLWTKGVAAGLYSTGDNFYAIIGGAYKSFGAINDKWQDGKWHNLTLCLSGNTNDSLCYYKFYLDAEKIVESSTSISTNNHGTAFIIGAGGVVSMTNTLRYSTNAHYSEFGIYDKSLGDEEIKEIYNDGKSVNLFYHRNAADLLHYYRFEDDTPVLKDWVAEKKGILRGHGVKGGTAGQVDSTSATAGVPLYASEHKNPRNTKYSVKFRHATSSYTADEDNYTLEVDRDNAYVNSLIPRSDAQYSWIRYSTVGDPEWFSGSQIGGFQHNSVIHHPSQGFDSLGILGYATSSTDITFVSQSVIASLSTPQDYAGMNTLIYDPISGMTSDPAQNLLGSTGLDADQYGQGIEGSNVPKPAQLHALLAKRNGAYNWPIWKQIRGGDHPIARAKRRTNILDFVNKWSEKVGDSGPHPKMKENITIMPFSESAVVGCYRPVSHLFEVGKTKDRVALRSSYANNLCTFTNFLLNSYLGYEKSEQQIHDQLYELYSDLENKPESPIKAFVKMKYKEIVFPSEMNMYRGQMRSRKEFTQKTSAEGNLAASELGEKNYRTFWRDSPTNRLRSAADTGYTAVDRFGRSVFHSGAHSFRDRASVWSMDVAERAVGSRLTSSEGGGYLPSLLIGQLVDPACVQTQNEGKFPSYLKNTEFTGTMQCMAYVNSVQSVGGTRIAYGLKPTTLFAQAEIESYNNNKFSWHSPMRDDYEDWAGDIRALGQSYSVLPEFRVSDHMDYYINDAGGNFFEENAAMLSLEGASEYSASSTSPTSSTQWEFYTDYSNSDFMKYFDVFRDSHKGIGDVDTYSITCRGIKKLLPYHGFYPQDRVAQLAQIFSASMASSTGSLAGDTSWGSPTQPGTVGWYKKLNAVGMPLFAPGVFFNSMKSGVAVDFPVFSGSTAARTTQYFATKPSYRIPFEASVDMVRHFPKIGGTGATRFGETGTILNHNLTGATRHIGGWAGFMDPRYEMASHNFMGEIPRFFLRQGGVSSFVSQKAQDQKPMMSGSKYYMDVCLYKTPNMVTTEGPRKSSDGEGVRGIVYGPPLSGAVSQSSAAVIGNAGAAEQYPVIGHRAGTNIAQISRTDPNYCAWTPPYFYGKSIARLLFEPCSASVMDSGSSQVFEMHEILANATVQYLNGNPLKQISDRDTGATDDLLSASWMPLTASVNLFDQVKLPLLDLDPITRQPTGVRQNSFEGQDVWKISTKWECPILNHSLGDQHSGSWTGPAMRAGLSSSITIGTSSCRALWNTYGKIPSGSEGVWLAIEDSFPEVIMRSGQRQQRSSARLTGSLIEFVGMQTGKQRVGEIAKQKEIEEAVIAIPYLTLSDVAQDQVLKKKMVWDETTGRYFFGINKTKAMLQLLHKEQSGDALPAGMLYPDAPAAKNTSITDMYEKVEKYVIPPPLDFTKNKDKDPFVMYIFEFSSVLTQTDLSHMWQGIAPSLSKRSEMQETTVSHKNSVHEFFEGGEIPTNVRWMVFKVKKRAETNYYNVRIGPTRKLDEAVMKFNFDIGNKEPEYTYNWPYDFCSLVELVQIEPEIVIKGNKTSGE